MLYPLLLSSPSGSAMAETDKKPVAGSGASGSAGVTVEDAPKYWYPDRLADMNEVGVGYPL